MGQYTVQPGNAMSVAHGRRMGCLPRRSKPGEGRFPLFREYYNLMPRADWKPVSMRHMFWHVYDQNGVGSCTCNAACGMVLFSRELQGLPRKVLSPGNLYGRINGGVDQGSALDDALEALAAEGVCTVEVQAANEWRKMASGWKTSGRHYKVLEWFDLEGSVDALFTSFQCRMPVVIGVDWPGGGGHAILATGCEQSGGEWEAEILNSWGEDWGEKGFGFLGQDTLESMPQYGCWAGRVVTSSDGD